MKFERFLWGAGLFMALVGAGLVLLGAFLMIELGTMLPSLTLMVVGFALVVVAQVTGSLATGQQGLHYIY